MRSPCIAIITLFPGKNTKLVRNYFERKEESKHPTKSFDSLLTRHTFACADIWDTAGQDSFNELHGSYYYGAHVAVLVFDSQRKVTY